MTRVSVLVKTCTTALKCNAQNDQNKTQISYYIRNMEEPLEATPSEEGEEEEEEDGTEKKEQMKKRKMKRDHQSIPDLRK